VRQPLLWLGQPDPVERVFEQLAHDPDRETLGRMVHAWYGEFLTTPKMVRDVVKIAVESDKIEIRELLLEVADVRGEISSKRLGKWLSRHQGRIVDGLRFERNSGTTSAERWQVKRVAVSTLSTVRLPQAAKSASEDCGVEL
jgi:hypothetical protein